MTFLDKKSKKPNVKVSREIKLYSDMNDCINTVLTSETYNLENDAEALCLIDRTFKTPQWFRIGENEYRINHIKRVKLGKVLKNETSSNQG